MAEICRFMHTHTHTHARCMLAKARSYSDLYRIKGASQHLSDGSVVGLRVLKGRDFKRVLHAQYRSNIGTCHMSFDLLHLRTGCT